MPIQKTSIDLSPIRTIHRKQENQSYSITKKALSLATGIISTFGLAYLANQHFKIKEIPSAKHFSIPQPTTLLISAPPPTPSVPSVLSVPSIPEIPEIPLPSLPNSPQNTMELIPTACIIIGLIGTVVWTLKKVAEHNHIRFEVKLFDRPATPFKNSKNLDNLLPKKIRKDEFPIEEWKNILHINSIERETKENLDKTKKIIDYLSLLLGSEELQDEDNIQLIQHLGEFTSRLIGFATENLDLPLVNEIVLNAYALLVKLDKKSALTIANACAKNLKPSLENIAREIIQKAKNDLKIPFGVWCSVWANFSSRYMTAKVVAKEIWTECEKSHEMKMEFLTECSKMDSPACQNRLCEHKANFQKNALDQSEQTLVTTCLQNLFNKTNITRNGNQAIILEACKDFRLKDQQTREFLLPIAKKIVNLYSGPVNASDLRTALHNITFNIFMYEDNEEDMESWLSVINDPTFYEITEDSQLDYNNMLEILNNEEKQHWKNIASRFLKESDGNVENNQTPSDSLLLL